MRDVHDKVIGAASAMGYDPAAALAVTEVESGFNEGARSPKGAQGAMQIMPNTAKELRTRYGDDHYAQGVGYLKELKAQYSAVDDPDKYAFAAYNAGPGNVQKAMKKAEKRGVDPNKFDNIARFLPEETRQYVPKVLGAIARQGQRPEAQVGTRNPQPNFETLSQMAGWAELSPDAKMQVAKQIIPEAAQLTPSALQRVLGIPETDTLTVPGTVQSVRGALEGMDRPVTPGGKPVGVGSFGSNVVETLTDPGAMAETVGGTLGEMGGGAIAGPPGAVIGGALGTAGARAGYNALTGKPNKPQELLTAGALGGAGPAVAEVGSRLVGRTVGALGGGVPSKTVKPGATEAVEFLTPRYAQVGFESAPMTAAEMTDSGWLDIGQNLAEGGFTGVGTMAAYKKSRDQANNRITNALLSEVSPNTDPTMITTLVDGALTHRSLAEKAQSSALTRDFLKRAGNIDVETSGLRKFAKGFSEQDVRLRGIEANPIAKALSEMGQAHKLQILGPKGEEIVLPPTMKVADLHELRKRLLNQARGKLPGERVPAQQKAFIKRAVAEVDNLISENVDDTSRGIWREANRLVKERKAGVDRKFLRDMVRKTDPESAGIDSSAVIGGDGMVNAVFKNENTIRQTQNALGADSKEYGALQRRYIEHKIASATDNGVINGQKLMEGLVGKNGENEAILRLAIPDGAMRRNWIQLANAFQMQQEKRSGVGKMLIQLSQGGVVLAAASTGNVIPAGLVTIGPYGLARLMTSKRGVKLLTEAFETPASAKRASSLALRIAAEAKMQEREEKNRRLMATLPGGQDVAEGTFPPGRRF